MAGTFKGVGNTFSKIFGKPRSDKVNKFTDPADLFGESVEFNEMERQQEIEANKPPQAIKPLPDQEEIARARKRSTAKQRGRSGRASTILSDDSYGSDALGG